MGQFTQDGVIYEELPNGQVRVVGHASAAPQRGAIPIGPRNNRQERAEARADEDQVFQREAAARAEQAAIRANATEERKAAAAERSANAAAKPTEFQSKSAGYLGRMVQAENDFGAVPAGERGGRSLPRQAFHNWAPGVENTFANTEERQKADQAVENFIAASLRQESGAAIAQPEFDRQYKIFFPAPGDGQEVLAQKAAARRQAISGFRIAAGPLADAAEGTTQQRDLPQLGPLNIGTDAPIFSQKELGAQLRGELQRGRGPENYRGASGGHGPLGMLGPEYIDAPDFETADTQTKMMRDGASYAEVSAYTKSRGYPGLNTSPEDYAAAQQGALANPGETGPLASIPTQHVKQDPWARFTQGGLGQFASHLDPLQGYHDEEAGLVNSLKNGTSFSSETAKANALKQAAEQAHPLASGLGTFAGGVAGGALAAKFAPGVVGRINNGRRAALASGGYGAVEGFGEFNDNRGMGALIGFGAGAVGGGAGYKIGQKIIAPAANELKNTRLGQAALAFLEAKRNGGGRVASMLPEVAPGTPRYTPTDRAMNKTGADLPQTYANLSAARDMGLPYAIADADPRLRFMAGSVSRQSPEAGAIAENFLEPRQMGQIDRLRESIGTNLAPETDIAQRGGELLRAGNTASSPYYAAANMRAAPVDDELKAMLNTRDGQDALMRARGIAENQGRDPNKMGFNLNEQGEVVIEQAPSFETLDLIKKGFDAKIFDGSNPITGKPDFTGNPQLRALNDYRARYVGKLDSLNPEYPKARAEYAKYAQQKEALDTGFSALPKALPRDMQAAIARTNPDTLPEMQRGYATAMSDRAQKISDTRDPFKTVYGSPAAREKIAALFPQGAPRFAQHYGLENDMAKTAREVLGGSQTAQRQGMDAAFQDGGMALPAEIAGSMSGVPGAGTATVKGLSFLAKRGIERAARKNAETLAPVLFSNASDNGAIEYLKGLMATNVAKKAAGARYGRRGGLFGGLAAFAAGGSSN